MRKSIVLMVFTLALATACTSTKTYENTTFPQSDSRWLPINPENFNKTEAERIYQGQLGK